MTKEALKLALEALEELTDVFLDTEGKHGWNEQKAINQGTEAILIIKEAIAQPAPQRSDWDTATAKCAVKDCENHRHQGLFVGLLCSPCHTFVSGDGGLYSQAYQNSRAMIDLAIQMERELAIQMERERVAKLLVMLDQTSHDTRRSWVGLTDEECEEIKNDYEEFVSKHVFNAIEAKLKEKNT